MPPPPPPSGQGYPPPPSSPQQGWSPAQPQPTSQQGWQQQSWQQPPQMVRTGSPLAWIALLGAIACAIGSGLVWIDLPGSAFDVTGFGNDAAGTKDGVLTATLAGIAAVLLLIGALVKNRVLHIVAAVLTALAVAIAIIDVIDVRDLLEGSDVGGVGIGLWITLAGAAVATVFAIGAAVQTRKRPA